MADVYGLPRGRSGAILRRVLSAPSMRVSTRKRCLKNGVVGLVCGRAIVSYRFTPSRSDVGWHDDVQSSLPRNGGFAGQIKGCPVNRTTRYKVGYVVALGVVCAISTVAVYSMDGGVAAIVAVAGVLFVPGRIQGLFCRELFRGRRLLDAGRPAEAAVYFERFLGTVRREPWRKRLVWISWPVYTPNVEAMALNNLGAAQLELGKIPEADAAFTQALELDPYYPLPYFNLAILQEMRGDRAGSERSVSEAARLGYTGGTLEFVIHRAQSLLARVEGASWIGRASV
jgi:hypothetical protein